MLDILFGILFCWLFFKVLGLLFRVAWGTAKVVASILLAVAVPLLFVGLVFTGGMMLLIPVALIAGAFGLLKNAS